MLVFARSHLWWSLSLIAGAVSLVSASHLIQQEMKTSQGQARLLSHEAARHFFWLNDAPNRHPLTAPDGPFDRRRGYTRIPEWNERLADGDYRLSWRAEASSRSQMSTEAGLFPIYEISPRAGLTIVSDEGRILHSHKTPTEIFEEFDDLPVLMVDTLRFIENRELLEPGYHYRNPAVEWRRLAAASAAFLKREFGDGDEHFGGSTLATQIEKFRHSPRGITEGEKDKATQMLSASLRAYQQGPQTSDHQRSIVVDYVNGVPLAASPGYGEVQGLADGLRIWFGADPDNVVQSLHRLALPSAHAGTPTVSTPAHQTLLDDARHFRMVLSLFLAQRRPSHYLLEHPEGLYELTDTYARLLTQHGLISPRLQDAVLSTQALVLPRAPADARPNFAQRKAVDAVRASLRQTLDVATLYELDRHDLYAQTTIDADAQNRVDTILHQVTDPAFLETNGLIGHRLIAPGDPVEELTVSFTLFERTPRGNALRILSDNHDQPLNINEHVKLDLGSTAKLRTLVTYLEIIAELYHAIASEPVATRAQIAMTAPDELRRWTAYQLAHSPHIELEELLERAMARQYSADPNDSFFTGGGLHQFSNFENRRNHVQSVREAFRHSVNLVFIRMMDDIVDYFIWLDPQRVDAVLGEEDTEERHYLLSRFAEREGIEFQRPFYARYQGHPVDRLPDLMVEQRTLSPESLALVALAFNDISIEDLAAFVARHSDDAPDDDSLKRWWTAYQPDQLSWQDRGYLTQIHPLELWTAAWLYHHPEATLEESLVASREVRQEVYQWLFRTNRRHRQDQRLRTLLEIEAFDQIHHFWQRLGYPFPSLVPSLATSIGSSADRPIALAELVGIISAGGLHYPNYRIEGLIAAPNTPYESRFERRKATPRRVLPEAVANTAYRALLDVVDEGTARRISNGLIDADNNPRRVGGKTGTGDHDHKVFDGLRLVEARPVHRTATFAFTVDERFFGSITVFASGEPSGQFTYTSALPTTLLKVLYPAFEHILDRSSPPHTDALIGPTDPGTPLALAAAGAPAQALASANPTAHRPWTDDSLSLSWHRLTKPTFGPIPTPADNELASHTPRFDWQQWYPDRSSPEISELTTTIDLLPRIDAAL